MSKTAYVVQLLQKTGEGHKEFADYSRYFDKEDAIGAVQDMAANWSENPERYLRIIKRETTDHIFMSRTPVSHIGQKETDCDRFLSDRE